MSHSRHSRTRFGRAVRFCRTAIESLETRRLLNAAIVVNTTADETAVNSTTSLREAIFLANNTAGDDTITFDAAVFSAGSLHTIKPLGEPFDLEGTMGKVTITGPGIGVLAIDGSGAGRSFDVASAAIASISGLTITGGIGAGAGGGIRNLGGLTLNNVAFSNNTVDGTAAPNGNDTLAASDGLDALGGAINSTGSLFLTNCSFTNNKVIGQAGGNAAFHAGNGGKGLGGAIYANGPVQLIDCSFTGNAAIGGQAGQKTGFASDGISGDGYGGAIYLGALASLTANNVNFFSNSATGGKGPSASGANAAGNGAFGVGGAIYSLAPTMGMDQVVFSANEARGGAPGDLGATGTVGGAGGSAHAGAMWSQGTLSLNRSTVTHNLAVATDSDPTNTSFGGQALAGGLMVDGNSTITLSSIDNNTAAGGAGGTGGFAAGGGIYQLGALKLQNSTLYGNQAVGGRGGNSLTTGGDGGKALGGAIDCDNVNALNALNVTIASNSAAGGAAGSGATPGKIGQAFGGGVAGGDVLNLTNTIVADNASTYQGPDLFGNFTLIHCLVTTPGETGYNMTVASAGNVGGPALLGGLADNGGPTKTVLPGALSPAVDAGDNAAALTAFGGGGQDQRNASRFAGVVDIGAVELTAAKIGVNGNDDEISNNDTTPQATDFTDYGTQFHYAQQQPTRTYVVTNRGNKTLNITSVQLPAGFSIVEPLSATIAPNAIDTFTVALSTANAGTFAGNIVITSSDPATPQFKFKITGTISTTFKVNFQPLASSVPDGYVADVGQVFHDQGNGLSYGWNLNAQTFTRDRNLITDQARDTFIHTQLYGNRTWEIAVPNGTYQVHIVAGDAGFFDSTYKINAENVTVVNGKPTNGNRFVEGTQTITVTDGKLTLSNAAGAVNNKFDFVEITPVVKAAIRINFQPGTSPAASGFLVDSGAVFGNRGNGQSYGWNQSAGSFARDRNAANSADQQHDTFIHTQLYGSRTWELALPNGTYTVHLVAGDPGFFDSLYKFNAEGSLILSGTPTAGNRWVEGTAQVVVADGRLTITNASGAVNNKIDFIEVTSA